MGSLLIKRYIWLINLLNRYSEQGLTLKAINSEWERSTYYKDFGGRNISRETLRNHCTAISGIWGIDIECIRSGANSYYRINTDEKYIFDQSMEWLLSSMATEELITVSKEIPNKILLEKPNAGSKYLSIIATALRDNIVLNIEYQSFHVDSVNQTDLLVEPLCLKMFKRRWYMLCRRLSDKAFRIYALDRLHKIELTPEHFTYPENFSPQEYFAPYYGISTDGYAKQCRVLLKAYQELPKYLVSQPLHHSQEIKEQTPEYTVFEYWIIPAFDFVQEILLHSEQLEVLEPEPLRQLVKEKIERITDLYR